MRQTPFTPEKARRELDRMGIPLGTVFSELNDEQLEMVVLRMADREHQKLQNIAQREDAPESSDD